MDRRAQLWKALLFQMVLVMVVMGLPSIIDVTATSVVGSESTGSINERAFSQIKSLVKVAQGIIVVISTLSIMFIAIRLVFFDALSSSSTGVRSSEVATRNRPQEQPSVADALEGLLASSSQSETSSEPQDNSSSPTAALSTEDHSNTIVTTNAATRVIREKPAENPIVEKEDIGSGVKRVIRS